MWCGEGALEVSTWAPCTWPYSDTELTQILAARRKQLIDKEGSLRQPHCMCCRRFPKDVDVDPYGNPEPTHHFDADPDPGADSDPDFCICYILEKFVFNVNFLM